MLRTIAGIVCFSIFAISWPAAAMAENWPCWRGPRGDGSSVDAQVPVRWSADENIAWKVPFSHRGHASPIVWENRIFLVGSNSEQQDRVLASLDRKTGKLLWEVVVVHSPLEKIHQLNSYASSTPATDGERIYASFLDQRQMLIAAYDFDGNELWKVQPGVFSSTHGYCSSPLLFEDKVIINGDHDGEAYLVALDRATGKTLWKTPRENKTRSYCTPIIREINGRTQMMLSGSKSVASYDPHDGSRQWIIDGPTEQFVASLVYNQGLLFVTGGFPDKHILAIDPTGTGNVSKSHIVWRERKGVSYVPSPVAVDKYFLMVSDDGIGTCYEALTGKIEWQERIGGRHYSPSLVAANGLAYFLDDDGIMRIVKPGPKLDVIAVNDLHEPCYASPAISQGQIFIRGEKMLYCIGRMNETAAGK